MTIETYPATPIPSYSSILDHEFRTLISDFESGKEQRRTMWRFPKRTFALIYKALAMTESQRDALYEFFQNRRGPYESFWFFDFIKKKWVDQYVGYGDSATDIFDLPSKDSEEWPKIYVAGSEKTRATHWNFISGGGGGGSDRIQFIGGNIPTTGQLITADFSGNLRIKGRFKDPKLTEEIFEVDFTTITVSIYEVKY